MGYIQAVSGDIQSYDARIFSKDFSPIQDPYIHYLENTTNPLAQNLFEALHVADSPKDPIWQKSSGSVSAGYQSDYVVDYSGIYNYLLD